MREYGRVHCAFWTSADVREMSDTARHLALYLLTCPHSTIAGVFRLPDGYACEDLGWTPERVREGFAELFDKGFANRCETTKWVWIRRFLSWNPPENPNQRKSAAKFAGQIPDACDWKPAFMRDCGELLGLEPPAETEPFRNRSETLSQSGTGTGTGTEEKQCATPDGFARFWSAYPKRKNKGDALKAWKAIKPSDGLVETMLAAIGLARLTEQWRKEGGQFIPYPASWLRARGWEDEDAAPAVDVVQAGVRLPWYVAAGFGSPELARAAGFDEPRRDRVAA